MMIDKPRREIDVIASELQTALKRETSNIITIGDLLLEANEQLQHVPTGMNRDSQNAREEGF